MAHFQNLIGLFIGVSNDGLNRALLTKIKSDYSSRAQVFLQTGLLNVAWWLIAGVLYFCFHQYLEREFTHTFHGHWAIYLWLGVLLMILQNQIFQTALATRGVALYAFYSISSAVVLTVGMYCAGRLYDFQGVLIVYVATPVIVLVLAMFTYGRNLSVFAGLKNIFETSALKSLAQFGVMALAIMLMGRLSSFVVREFAIDNFGAVQTGLWQAAVKVSDGYSAVFTALINLMYHPKIAESINDQLKMRKVLRRQGSLLVALACSGLFLLWLIEKPVLSLLLYNDSFVGASVFLNVILLKDALKFMAWMFSYMMFSQARLKYFLLFEAVSAIIYVMGTMLWAPAYGIMATVYAELLAVAVFLIMYLIYYRKLWLPARS